MSDSATGGGGAGPLLPSDLELLAGLGRANEWTRSLLCTLARRGTRVRHTDPDRTTALLEAVAAWPWYKAGQFLFDLLEWEDFMVDGPAPAHFAGDAIAVRRLVRLLWLLASQLDGTLPEWADEGGEDQPTSPVPAEDLPALEPGFYLYQDVIVGVLVTVSTSGSPPAPA